MSGQIPASPANSRVVSSPRKSTPKRRVGAPKLDNKLPRFRDVCFNERQQLFLEKVQQCNVIYNFTESGLDRQSKEAKLLTLNELQRYVEDSGLWVDETMWRALVEMFAKNAFRRTPHCVYSSGEMYDAIGNSDEEPTPEIAWLHVGAVYQLFIAALESKYLIAELADESHVDQEFVTCLLKLFESEDPRERDFTKKILHCIYRVCHHLRPFIRQSINNIFLKVTYETGTCTGIAELLEMVSSIITGLSVPLEGEYMVTLHRVLLPLHKAAAFGKYHLPLAYCMTKFIEKRASLSNEVIAALLRYWPRTSSEKECMFLDEIGDIMDASGPTEFTRAQEKLFMQLAKCTVSPHVLVARRALFFWSNEKFCDFVEAHVESILPIMFTSVYESSDSHWNRLVRSTTYDVMMFFVNSNPHLFDDCLYSYHERKLYKATEQATRDGHWEAERKRADGSAWHGSATNMG